MNSQEATSIIELKCLADEVMLVCRILGSGRLADDDLFLVSEAVYFNDFNGLKNLRFFWL